MAWLFIALIFIILALAILIDNNRKKNNNNPHITIDPNTKSRESSNYLMGDNKDTGGFQ
ncbi:MULTISPECIES: hypothetical protein [unclassified Bacillus (in: firmicutes)]|uniref:hypothetical protein n=1 Tax=unclassified Bacillus (in: firmicutes) TaxID=185979 RepID=UPI0008F42C7B|nr:MULTISPECIES: hypothetical protein [unclassified Bacillus (in: firmicutes)]SFA90694.1 hypothetical protein SAMN02799634_102503 [Bacillus sp. UNCCL13]SFQ85340.1 hypothetical protein SAMN04488577_2623 [Bacillus sp. cl95]